MITIFENASLAAEFPLARQRIIAAHGEDFQAMLREDDAALGVFFDLDDDAVTRTRIYRQSGILNLIYVVAQPDVSPQQIAAILNAGADQVQPFPVDGRLFNEQCRALARRASGDPSPFVHMPCGLIYDRIGRYLIWNNKRMKASRGEMNIFDAIVQRNGGIISRQRIHERCYGHDLDAPEPKIIDVLISRLRRRLIYATGLDFIRGHWGRGWQFVEQGFEPKQHVRFDKRIGHSFVHSSQTRESEI